MSSLIFELDSCNNRASSVQRLDAQNAGGYRATADAEFALPQPVNDAMDMEFLRLHFPCHLVPNVHPAFGNDHLLFVNGHTNEHQIVRVPAGRYAGLTELLAALNAALHAAAADTSTPWVFPFQGWFFHALEDNPECGGATRVVFEEIGRPAILWAEEAARYHWSCWRVATNACFGGLAQTLGFVPVDGEKGENALCHFYLQHLVRPLPEGGTDNGGVLPAPANVSGGALRLLPNPISSLVVHVNETHDFSGAGRGNRIVLAPDPARSIARDRFGAAAAGGACSEGTPSAIALCSVSDQDTGAQVFTESRGNVVCAVRKRHPYAFANGQYQWPCVTRLRVTITNGLLQPVPLPDNAYFTIAVRFIKHGT